RSAATRSAATRRDRAWCPAWPGAPPTSADFHIKPLALRDEPDDAERREFDARRERLLVPWSRLGVQPAEVPRAGAAVEGGVGVQGLAPAPRPRQADPVLEAWDRREVADAGERAAPARVQAEERERVVARVVRFQPAEAVGRGVDLPQRRLLTVEPVQVAHERLHALVLGPLEQVPIERAVVAPLLLLREL